MVKLLLCLTIQTTLLSFISFSFSLKNLTYRRVLVLLNDFAIKSSHSLFSASRKSQGLQLDFKLVDDPNIDLQYYNQSLSDAMILF